MTRSSTKELFTAFKDPEREFRSSRKNFKTLSLDESRSPNFDLFSDQEEYSEEEVEETMAETMEQYMSKTQADYGSKVVRPKIEDKDNFEIKGQFLKEQTWQLSKVQQERGLGSLPSSTETNPRDHVNSISTIVETDASSICSIGSHQYVIRRDHVDRASVSVMPLSTYLNLGLGELAHTKLTVELANRTMKYPIGIAENVLVDYIELNDLNVPLELRRDQVDDLIPTIEEGEVIDEPMIDKIKTRNNESFDEEFYNSIIRDKVELKGKNVVRAFMNAPIFTRKFSIITYFVVVENMDGYRDQDMGDILKEPFYKASCVEAKRFDGLITIHNGSDNVTYQMASSHPMPNATRSSRY
ncbi:hypothetical protein Tco_0996431 [Tanacetum coccineum]